MIDNKKTTQQVKKFLQCQIFHSR